MLPQPQLLPQISVKGYRELLKRLKQHNDEGGCSSTLLQHARQLALAQRQRKHYTERPNPRRAFSRLRQRIVDTKRGLKELKDAKKESLRQRYTTLIEQRLAKRDTAEEAAVLGSNGFSRALVLGAVGLLSRGFMTVLNTTEVEGAERMREAFARPPGRGLLTVCNHAAALDDPLLLASLMPAASLAAPVDFRWGTCATDRCFKNGVMAAFFRAGKTLPVERGAGPDQPGIRAAEGCLRAGDWVHIFPEGTRSPDGRLGRLRRGVGHLVAACRSPPIVLPFAHSGMDGILPHGSKLPRIGQRVRVLVGEPLSFDDLSVRAREEQWTTAELAAAITDRVAEALYQLKARLEGLEVRDIVADGALAAAGESAALLPLIQEKIDGLRHAWGRGLPTLPQVQLLPRASAAQGSTSDEQQSTRSLRDRLAAARATLSAASPLAAATEFFSRGPDISRRLAF